jgi:SAM-dependent methyltransferase
VVTLPVSPSLRDDSCPNTSSFAFPDLLETILVCPRDKKPFIRSEGRLTCPQGHSYVVVDGVPILLVEEMEQTHIEGNRSLAVARAPEAADLPQFEVQREGVDPFVSRAIGATNGGLYQHLVGNLTDYPIPDLRMYPGKGRLFLDIGCNWGRWCVAASRLGYVPVGIDPSLKSIRAARRVADQLGISAHYIVADSRNLPFSSAVFDQIFSYSVLQHLSPTNVEITVKEMQRVLKSNGRFLVQMPNVFGVRCLYHQVRRGFRRARDFEVRYWTPAELVHLFSRYLEDARISVDGFFSLNAQISDLRFMPFRYRVLVSFSEILRRLSRKARVLTYVADSIYVGNTDIV